MKRRKLIAICLGALAIGCCLAVLAFVFRTGGAYRGRLADAAHAMPAAEIASLTARLSKDPGGWWIGDHYNNQMERGIIRLKNGRIIRFAFISHHVAEDHRSYSYFYSDDYARYVNDGFCCEVEFDGQQPSDISDFDRLLSKVDGEPP